jgi:hypothetical protein
MVIWSLYLGHHGRIKIVKIPWDHLWGASSETGLHGWFLFLERRLLIVDHLGEKSDLVNSLHEELKMIKKIFSSIGICILLLTLFTSAVIAGSWEDKVTGGGQAVAGGTYFSLTLSASTDDFGNARGQAEYSRYNGTLDMHVDIACLWVAPDLSKVFAAGPAMAQVDPGNYVESNGGWVGIVVKEGGIGSGDTVRIWGMDEETGRFYCENGYAGSPSVEFFDGNINIRGK